MIYLDNAATSWPKPSGVQAAVIGALRTCANPGRSGHSLSLAAADVIYKARENAADFFGLDDPARVVFAYNCTTALNMVLKGLLKGGGRAVISSLEHNAVLRPLASLSDKKIYDIARVEADDDATVANFRAAITPATRALVCVHASNVWGTVLPIEKLAALARTYRLPLVVDGAQTGGVLPLSMEHIDFLCLAGHKGLYGPMGVGLLLCGGAYALPSFIEGGTGSASRLARQPEELPEHLESGTPNVAGICGVSAGLDFVHARGADAIYTHELRLVQWLYERAAAHPRLKLYTPYPVKGKSAPVLSFNVDGMASEEMGAALAKRGAAVRCGLHCAPLAHEQFGTLESGAIRVAPSAFTTEQEMRTFWGMVKRVAG
ncbi:MAG: aminotransferase class V-fold PLP-dependent enzyme [Oscillospiraceae bacterium]|nr:aminotransferase class V-fold PLP-dependent enzyme [Oscillospiraceae bacterium]